MHLISIVFIAVSMIALGILTHHDHNNDRVDHPSVSVVPPDFRPRKPRRRPYRTPFVRDLRAAHRAALTDDRELLRLGDMYRRGMYPEYRPNTDLALRLFKTACASPDAAVAGMAQAKFIECRLGELDPVDVAGRDPPTLYGESAIQHARRRFQNATGADRPRWINPAVVVRTFHANPEIHATIEAVPPLVYGDTQNVHDHGVVKALQRTLEDLPPEDSHASQSVTQYILDSQLSAETKSDALDVLESLNVAPHSAFGASERSALERVWTAIQELPEDRRDDAKDVLVSQLASGIEHGNIVCSTGKIARIVGTLDGLTDDPGIKPMWAVREEIASLAAKVRDEDGTSDDFAQRAHDTYVRDLGLQSDIVRPIVEEMILGFDP